MKFFRLLFSLIISAGLIFILDQQISIKQFDNLPPFGKLLNPFHGFWQNAKATPYDIPSSFELSQLDNVVTVQYEDNLIPHIFSESEYDLYFTQGFVTASHRLWQMEFLTYVAAGRVSEILGQDAVNFDQLQRRKGLMYGAENSLKALENHEEQFSFIQAYSDGVNAYIDDLEYADYPVEYKLLDYAPERWYPVKSILLLKYMADDLSGSDHDLQNTNAVRILGKDRFDFLFPDFPENTDPIIPEGTKWNFDPVEIKEPESIEIFDNFRSSGSNPDDGGKGSNNWAVSGRKTESGYPILCNDPHLGFSMPSIWFAQQLHGPGINAYGVTIPGLPGILLGFNDSIAWGLTNAPRDVRDWYHINFKDKERSDYLYEGKWLKTQKRIEKIKVRDSKTFVDTIIFTHYGPVVYDRDFQGDTTLVNFALHWTAHHPTKEILALFQFNRSKNLGDMQQALENLECPPQNVAVATRQGDIGIFVAGKFPLKWNEQGKFLMDGSKPQYEWQGFIPVNHAAHIINPERGFISSSNQHPFTIDYPYYYYNNTAEYFRNRRINSKLTTLSNITIEDMKSLQNDNYHMIASESLPVMLDSLDITRLNQEQLDFINTLQSWDYMASPNLIAPSYFEAWWKKLESCLWDEFDRDLALKIPDEYITINLLNNYPQDSAFDILDTPEKETINDIIHKSLQSASDSIKNWKESNNDEEPLWYKFKNTRLMHLTRLSPLSYTEIPVGGNKHIVNANWPTGGASWRMIVELGDEIRAYGIYPGGQSGNPGNPAYDSFIDMWANGQYFEINFWDNPTDSENVKTITFKPEDQD